MKRASREKFLFFAPFALVLVDASALGLQYGVNVFTAGVALGTILVIRR